MTDLLGGIYAKDDGSWVKHVYDVRCKKIEDLNVKILKYTKDFLIPTNKWDLGCSFKFTIYLFEFIRIL